MIHCTTKIGSENLRPGWSIANSWISTIQRRFGLFNRLKYAIWTHGDAAFASATFLGVPNNHMLVKPDVHFSEYVVFAFVDTIPAGFTLTGIYADMLRAVSFC
jgi:hypothetical protein